MADNTTGAMQEFGGSQGPSSLRGPKAGLVLLYAENFAQLPAAWVLAAERTVIGRDASADLPLPVPAVSRRHAEVSWADGEFVVRDLGSRNGTLLDGSSISSAVLEHASEIRIGDAILKFVEKHADSLAAYRIDGSMLHGQRRAKHPKVVRRNRADRDRCRRAAARVVEVPDPDALCPGQVDRRRARPRGAWLLPID